MRALPIAIGVVTGALTLNGVLAVAQGPAWLVAAITTSELILLPWLSLATLRDGPVKARELGEREEWGYLDRPDLRPERRVHRRTRGRGRCAPSDRA